MCKGTLKTILELPQVMTVVNKPKIASSPLAVVWKTFWQFIVFHVRRISKSSKTLTIFKL